MLALSACMYAANGSHDGNVTLTNGPVGTNSSGLSSIRESEVRARTQQDHLQHVQNQAYAKAGSDVGLQHTYATLEPPPSETCFKQGNIHAVTVYKLVLPCEYIILYLCL